MKTILLLLAASLCSTLAYAQTTLSGKATDAITGEPVIFAAVALYKQGVLIAGTETDFEGNYAFSPIEPGTYELEASYLGFAKKRITDVKALAGKANRMDMEMSFEGIVLETIVVTEYKVPLVEQETCYSNCYITSEQIRNLPTRNLNALTSATACWGSPLEAEKDGGQEIHMRSCRSCDCAYYIDGVRVSGCSLPECEEPEAAPARPLKPALPPLRAKYFPNPASGPFYLRLEEGLSRLAIRNPEGKLILETGQLDMGDHEFSAENWAPGLYLLELHQGRDVTVEKLVVAR
ncbi:MAG: carboxypeptidase regulatory-like domain-containing protein [Phaeodactylibacter sp.]|nr:carboxypeptidase regulatory-like domain-containing protein [Phaeodactylibacter sp.]MCB9294929.1 carboxypeptidase regulatory-like domain-containing protein [Lewinellaceae bacterium]